MIFRVTFQVTYDAEMDFDSHEEMAEWVHQIEYSGGTDIYPPEMKNPNTVTVLDWTEVNQDVQLTGQALQAFLRGLDNEIE